MKLDSRKSRLHIISVQRVTQELHQGITIRSVRLVCFNIENVLVATLFLAQIEEYMYIADLLQLNLRQQPIQVHLSIVNLADSRCAHSFLDSLVQSDHVHY